MELFFSTIFRAIGSVILVVILTAIAGIVGVIVAKIWKGLAPGPDSAAKKFDKEMRAVDKLEQEINAVKALGEGKA